MNTVYKIIINIKTLQGMLEVGSFFLGSDADFAHSVFDNLKRDLTTKDDVMLRIDLEKKDSDNLPVILKSISCTLDEYAENCKIITRDVFKFFTLEQ